MAMREQERESPALEGPPGPSLQSLLDRERASVPAALRSVSQVDLGLGDVDRLRYLSREWHDLEVERVWKRVWQVACRVEDIPDAGDTLIYEIADLSVIVVRVAPDEIKAYPNACLHRGALLRSTNGNTPELRCPFHGFCWHLDGSLKEVPCSWDFPHVTPDEFALPEVQVAVWEGFVCINMDPGAPSLDEYFGGAMEQIAAIARPRLGERYKAAHVAKLVRCNWKVGIEAFVESFHSITTHPQALMWADDVNTQYDIYPGERHWSRMVTPSAVPSPHLGPGVPEQEVADSLLQDLIGIPEPIPVPEGSTARRVIADVFRTMAKNVLSYDATDLTDCQVLDTIGFLLFPNMIPFVGLLSSFNFRLRPYGNDPDMAIMEVMVLHPIPADGPCPPAAEVHWLDIDESWTKALELGNLAPFMDQDTHNLGRVQKGLHAMTKPGLTLGRYQENRIRHFNTVLDEYLRG